MLSQLGQKRLLASTGWKLGTTLKDGQVEGMALQRKQEEQCSLKCLCTRLRIPGLDLILVQHCMVSEIVFNSGSCRKL